MFKVQTEEMILKIEFARPILILVFPSLDICDYLKNQPKQTTRTQEKCYTAWSLVLSYAQSH